MPTRKITGFTIPKHMTCRSPSHDPPSMRLFEPGTYQHTCPTCGHTTTFMVEPKPTMSCSALRLVTSVN